MKIELSILVHAPIDLVWEFITESSFEREACPISGLQGGEILEEYEDGLLREVIFNNRLLTQRVFIRDESYSFRAVFKGDKEGGEVLNQLEDIGQHITKMDIICEWQAPDLTDDHQQELLKLFSDRLESFKKSTEDLWAEKGIIDLPITQSTMH
ncbi:SRPBCC family protein [Curvivirga aplysinae]|uniref:SRPBCC family protein n=1 Tax=Curvivirga aplysinae TaxID=2529852 RepID=UPI0012BCAF83|nr:SRPBCC family protein [Curvivirga aplysinae]MTI09945.1 SRPBCC family protein [Curvivirga aplysinae]